MAIFRQFVINITACSIVLLPVCFLFVNSAHAQQGSLNYGLLKPQDAATLPKSKAPFQKSVLKPKKAAHTVLERTIENEFLIKNGWEMISANKVSATPVSISTHGFNTTAWYNATVPGTVLTTLVNQGVYPNPYWGLNNLSIPDTLCRQQWWYRTSFTVPVAQQSKQCWLILKGINYEADVWLNGKNIGRLKGAFKHGNFNISAYLSKKGSNTLAINIISPPHPGIPHEQSVLAQRGPNGGALCLDGPTFISSEGWDWIPGIRDRNIGLWQDVALRFTGDVEIIDPQIITDLPLPDTSSAEVNIKTGLYNSSSQEQKMVLKAEIGSLHVQQTVFIPAGQTKQVTFSPEVFKALNIHHPQLWWPNGYGKAALYQLKLSVLQEGAESDYKLIRFGIRELSYELSVDAPDKQNWRVEYNPTKVFQKSRQPLFNNAKWRNAGGETVIPELYADADISLLKEIKNPLTSPYLVVKVNGKRIFCKGGNWGMDDGMKRTSRAFLEPYFNLTRDAHFNMIRNWTGESTEETFYELCDEYGLLVWNDFWISTENYNLLPQKNQLFLDNAKNVIHRFRNHPSIAIWCPRNEGFVPPALELPLSQMIAAEDGTRLYQPNSRYMNLRTSGPWNYQKDPSVYFTRIADGFSTEVGTTSVPTAATMRKMMAEEDLWPIGDVWHYHDFHFGQQDYVNAIDSLYGKATGLDDFCKKAQLVNYDSHRAMFEAWNSKMWNNASGMLIWMSQPAWPSTVWQAYSSDFETFGSYYGAKNACEPLHIQYQPVTHQIAVANMALHNVKNLIAKLTLWDVKGAKLFEQYKQVDASANQLTDCFIAQVPVILPSVYLMRLQLLNNKGNVVSRNDYWQTGSKQSFEEFNGLPNTVITGQSVTKIDGYVNVTLKNKSAVPCIGIKLNVWNAHKKELMLPAIFSDGYFNLLPGESRLITLMPGQFKGMQITASAYNMKELMVATIK